MGKLQFDTLPTKQPEDSTHRHQKQSPEHRAATTKDNNNVEDVSWCVASVAGCHRHSLVFRWFLLKRTRNLKCKIALFV